MPATPRATLPRTPEAPVNRRGSSSGGTGRPARGCSRTRCAVLGRCADVARFASVDDDGYFGERVAARYDASDGEMFDPEVVGPVVDLLVELAGSGRALEL